MRKSPNYGKAFYDDGESRPSRYRLLSVGLLIACLIACTAQPGGLRWAESSHAPQIHVNQNGYLPNGPKVAILRSRAPQPLEVELIDVNGEVIWQGVSLPQGLDKASGEKLHRVDFSAFRESGTGYRLKADGRASFPFKIDPSVYGALPQQALKYFYHNRSGIPLTMPYVSSTWSRPAGHLSDEKVACVPGLKCDYTLDVRGGWYDAGDYGKYVVNGGISVWTLQNLAERLIYLGPGIAALGDGSLNIPESKNGIPDLLDEARFELEFLLRMQVPEGKKRAGMAHHKVHDTSWSALAMEPPTLGGQRLLHPPSTAATLNLAAAAAQGARVWKDYDPAFADYCLKAARRAWQAALENPAIYASKMDNQGGGAYDDQYVGDEFYWAAVELYLTTRDEQFLQALQESPHHKNFPIHTTGADGHEDLGSVSSSMTWQSTAGLGWLSLAIVPHDLPARETYRKEVIAGADHYLRTVQQEGFRIPLGTGEQEKYPWGSNSFILNNMIVLALAHDWTHEKKYSTAMLEGMDYLLGKNPLHQSYISGYGSIPLQHPHHRF
ncbi:MAG: glycoside hydrolase family 9 protein, partial [Polyangiaceae bacterium]|nr:glycoside hydrolase family 9 protein [Polyangiaceae bacterium]